MEANYDNSLLAGKDAEIAELKATLGSIFEAWREVGAHDGFLVVTDTLHFYRAVQKHIPELKEDHPADNEPIRSWENERGSPF